MSKQKNNEVIRKNELGYLQTGDYFIPDLKLPQENRSIGKYGRMHRDYLQEHNLIRVNDLVLEGTLWTYLADLDEQAQNRLQLIISQMQEEESVNDELKETMATLIEQSVAQQFGEDTDYIEVTKSEFTDTAMELELAMDVTAMTEANGGTSEDLTIASFVTEMEKSGMSCN